MGTNNIGSIVVSDGGVNANMQKGFFIGAATRAVVQGHGSNAFHIYLA